MVAVEKSYPTKSGRRPILDGISAVFERGHSTGVLGVNGAGKSTLLRILSGSERPDRGQVRRSVSVSWPLGFSGSFSGSLTGRENLRFVARIYGADIEQVTDFVEDFSELGRYMDEPVRTYSAGMRARLAFALSMAVDFQVYLVDEAIGVGDAAFQQKCNDAFNARRSRSDVIMTSHYMSTIREYCTRAGVMENGRLLMFEDIDAAEEYYNAILKRRA
nr:ABC transporter ATP-binding protein [Caulobacter sp. 17J80-11]